MICWGWSGACGTDGNLAVQFQGHRAVEFVAAGQAVQCGFEEPRVRGIQPQPGRDLAVRRDDPLDRGEPGLRLDHTEDRPGAGADHDVRLGPADLDRLIARESPAGEDRAALDQQVAGPGKAETRTDQQLPSVGGDDLAASPEAGRTQANTAASRAMVVSVASARAVSSPAGLVAQVAGSSGDLAQRGSRA